MKKRILCPLIMLGFGMQANAVVIGFSPGDQNVGLGDSVSVDLVISGLGDDILTGFDIDIMFDEMILGFDSFVFGTGCGGFSCLDVLGLGSLQDEFNYGFGEYNVFELSFDPDADLINYPQPNAFTLGTFTFTALGVGNSVLDVSFGILSGGYGSDHDPKDLAFTVVPGSIAVPEPGTWLLLMTGLLGIRMMGRRRAIRA